MYSSFQQIAAILSVTRSTVRSEGSADARSRCLPRRTHSNPCEMALWQGDRSLWGSGVRGRGGPLPPLDLPVVAMSVAFDCSGPAASAGRAVQAEAKGAASPVPRCRSPSLGSAQGGRVAGRVGLQRSIDWTFGYVLQQWHQWPTCTWTEDAIRDFCIRSTGMDATDPLDLWRTATATVTAPGAAPRR